MHTGIEAGRRCGRGRVGQGREQGKHFSVEINLEGSYCKNIASQVELAVSERWEQQRWIDVRLHDEMAEL